MKLTSKLSYINRYIPFENAKVQKNHIPHKPYPTPTSVLPVRFLSPPPSPTVSSPNGATTDQHRRNPTSKNLVHKYQNRFLTEKL